MKLIKANILFTKDKNRFEVLEHGCVVVDKQGRVAFVAANADDIAGIDIKEVVDYGDRLLIPAMCDLHVHAPQYRNQGLAMDLQLIPWLNNYTFPEEAKFADTRYAEHVYSRFVRDLWRYGTMRTVAFATIHPESTRLLMKLFRKAGMAALVGKVDMDRNAITALEQPVAQAIAANEAIIAECNDPNALVRPIITPRFIPSCSPELLQACGRLAAEHGLPVQSHLSENPSEIEWVRQLEPDSRFYGDAYDRYGLFGQTPTVMAHCVYSSQAEIDLMAERGVTVAHCPTSNLNLSSGMAPVRRMLEGGVRVGLGSDMSGGHDLSIFRMMIYAVQVSKMHYQRDNDCRFLTLPEVFWLATKSAGAFFGKVGSFEPGYEFDALVIDDSALNHFGYTPLERLERFIYLGDDRHIVCRYCRGIEVPEPDVS